MLQMAKLYSFLWQISSCPLYIYSTSSVDGQLGCFHVLAIVNNVAVNIGGTYISSNECFFFSPRYILRIRVVGLYAVLFLVF